METFGISWKTMQKLEYGITEPKVGTLLKLADAFRIGLSELLTFSDGAKPE
jgi:DNA-binding XRE family transcriptional regulator